MKNTVKIVVLIISIMIFSNFSEKSTVALAAGLPAFPGAVGFGSDTPGGREGRIIEVTNLNNSGAGSLREACSASEARIIVFRTGGTIQLSSNIKISQPYVTIAGQSAPGDGIALRGAGLTITTHDVVVRDIRIRVGDDPNGPSASNRDALQIEGGASDIVIDHVSLSWAVDETLTIWNPGTKNVTVSNCIIAEGLKRSIHPEGEHSMGALAGPNTDRVAFIGNLFAHNNDRNPRVRSNSAVIVNNLNYDIGWRNANISGATEPQQISIVGNVFKKGPSSYGSLLPIHLEKDIVNGSKIYMADNECSDYTNGNCYKNDDSSSSISNSIPIWPDGLVAKSSKDVLEWVLANVGARHLKRDAVDAKIINDVRNKIGGMIDSPKNVGGWPQLDKGVVSQDSDKDGVPDNWEIMHGLNPNSYNDGKEDRDNDGYTNVEEYLNSLIYKTIEGEEPKPALNPPENLRVIPTV